MVRTPPSKARGACSIHGQGAKIPHASAKNTKYKNGSKDFPGGTLDKNPPANAGDTGLIPGLGRSHMPWSHMCHNY